MALSKCYDVAEVKNSGDDEDERRVREAAMRRRLDINKHPVDVGELHSNIEIEDVIVTMLKILYYPL
ncbi:hypothetical protein LIER_16194 [Lithospermum erythrorhizon]|uniref:Uncharacterized protein n=1 Tax=Lithospermum erythrorhizon TaxID=34254 RepID=A0AAV3QB33_LITER